MRVASARFFSLLAFFVPFLVFLTGPYRGSGDTEPDARYAAIGMGSNSATNGASRAIT